MQEKEPGESPMETMAKEAIKEKVTEALGSPEELRSFIAKNLKELLEEMVNSLMHTERKLFVQKNGDVGNGFYPRNLQTAMGKLNLNVPRTRVHNFKSSLLPPPYKRTDESYDQLLLALIQSGYSPNSLRNTLASLNLNYSPKEIEAITEDLKDRYYDFVQKELPADAFALYIDAYRAEMKDKQTGKVKTITIYTIIGVTLTWKKTLFGFYLEPGLENKQGWLKIFNDLISRGLRRISLIISDDFPGLKEAIQTLFPQTDHQLCLTHFKRNITRNMSCEDAKNFKDQFDQLKIAGCYEGAVRNFEKLILNYQDTYKTFMAQVWLNREQYLTFLKYPAAIRKYIYTTNVSENFHRRLEWLRQRMGGFFQSEEVLGINVVLQLDRLTEGKWSVANTHFKAHEYELLQIHRLKFSGVDEHLKNELKKAETEMAIAANAYKKMDIDLNTKINAEHTTLDS
jgi:transposase-like protein